VVTLGLLLVRGRAIVLCASFTIRIGAAVEWAIIGNPVRILHELQPPAARKTQISPILRRAVNKAWVCTGSPRFAIIPVTARGSGARSRTGVGPVIFWQPRENGQRAKEVDK
jgi:hypothetical protein